MSFANVALYIAILGFMVYRRVQGKPAGSPKQLFVLPIILCVLGYQDLVHQSLNTVDVNALSVKQVQTYAISIGGGFVGGIIPRRKIICPFARAVARTGRCLFLESCSGFRGHA